MFVLQTVCPVDHPPLCGIFFLMAVAYSDDHQAFYEEIGRRIRDARKQLKPPLTQEDLARSVGLTRTSITNVEQGRQKCLLHTFFDIAVALHVEPASLFPANADQSTDLNRSLMNSEPSIKEWVLSTLTAAQKGKSKHGS